MKHDEVVSIIKKFANEVKSNGESVLKQIKKMDRYEEVISYLKSYYGDYDIKVLIGSVLNDLDTIPIAACGNVCRFDGLKLRYVCTSYKMNKEETCPECHIKLKEIMNNNRMQSVEMKYGTPYISKVPEFREKAKNTMFNEYGVYNISNLDSVKKKKSDNYHNKSLEEKERIKEKNKKKVIQTYGVDNVSKSEIVKQKKLGNKNPFNNSTFKIKNIINTTKRRYNSITDYLKTNDKPYTLTYMPFAYKDDHVFQCKCGEIISCKIQSFDTIRCYKCFPLEVSSGELWLRQEIENIISNTSTSTEMLLNQRYDFIDNREIDIYLPELKIGFEFNGSYWHNDEHKDKYYHQKKSISAKNNGINLIHIHESDYNKIKDKIVMRLKHVLNKNDKTIYARKCIVKEVSFKESEVFLDEYHFQQSCVSGIRIGLYYDNELVALATYGKSRYDKKYEYELLRFCTKYSVPGGFSKIMKYFEQTYNPKSLMTYADLDWSNGNVYEKNGFEFVKYTEPSYFYVDKYQNKISRYDCRKTELLKLYDWATNDMTETEICKKLNYNKIYSSGNIVYRKIYNK
ncbi:hef-like homing endonuclease [Klebsiella phage Muenster]|nr:hef-like homing endonuclease [Klebsiella phage Muenster]